ncbi:putative nucleotidyltransferase, ribonuclease H [Tanacetum coccineum]
MQAPLRARFRDLPTVDMKEILQQRMFEDDSYKAHTIHNDLYEALQKSLETPPGSTPSPPPPPPPPAGAFVLQQQGSKAPSSSKTAASASQSMAWTTFDTRFKSTDFTAAQELSPTDSLMQDDSIPDEQVHLSDDEDSKNDHLPKADSRQDWWKPLPEEERPATPEPAWTISSSNKSDTNPEGDQVRVDVNQPLPPGHITVQLQFFFNKDLEYLRYSSKGRNPALSISKMKAASYPDFGLELLVPEQMWIEDVCSYDISAKYGISHWWFNRQKFYIDRHDSLLRRKDVRTHMRILSVVRIKTYLRYGYDYLSEIVLRRADFQEHTIAEKDFKNLYPSDFEDLNLLLLQGHLDHLPGSDKRMLSTAVKLWTRNLVIRQRVEDFQLGIESYQMQLNLTKPGWDATGYEFKHDYTIIESPRVVIFPKNAASGSMVIDENRIRDDTHQQPKKRGTSKDVVASLDQRVAGVETSMAGLKTQVGGLEGLDSNFTSMREDFRVALNTLSGDLKREIHNLRDSLMGEITKIREEFGEEVSTLHQVIKDLQVDMALCKRSLASGDDNTNHGSKIDVPKPTPFMGKKEARAVDDFLWEIRRYGDIERGTATIDTWAEFVADFKKQFYPENAKNEAKSQLRKFKQSGTIWEYVKEFPTLVLEIPELSDQDSLFYFLDGLQGWAKMDMRRESSKPKDRKVNQEKGGGEKNAQPKVDPARKPPTEKDKNLKMNYKSGGCFICNGPHRARDFSKKASLNGLSAHGDEDASDGGSMGSIRILNAIKAKTEVPKFVRKGLQYVEATINGVKVRSLVDSGVTRNFVADDEAKQLGINATKGSGTIKAVNSLAKAIHGMAKDVWAKIGKWEGTIDFLVVPMDDFKVVLGLEFLDRIRAFPMSFANSLCILDGGKTCMVSTEWDAKSEAKTLSAMQFKKGFNKSEPCYLAMTRLETDEGSSKMEVPKVIEQVLDEFKDVMPKELPKKLPPRREVDHTIKLEMGSNPRTKDPYQMPPSELEELCNQLKELMIAGYIRPSKAPYGVTIKNKYPTPLIADLFDQLGKARYFTKLDLRLGYYQVRIAEGDEAKTTCVIRYGSYEFLVMLFGLTNAPATFCTLMNKLFHMFLDKFVVVYLDDIVVYSHTLEEHVFHLKQVFQVLRDNKLYMKLEKCSFAQDEVEFLGHQIKDGGLMIDGAKMKAIQDWEPPTKVMELRSFLGLVNYYRRWDEECQAAFESLKEVIEELVLRLLDVTMSFELHTNASDFAIGGVLMQDRHPIAFESRKLYETKRKYTVQEKEMTAVVHCLRMWRHYLLGLRFMIKTDSIAMSYFQTQKKLSPKQACWQDFLAEFDYQLKYKPRKANVVANALSCKTEFAAITQAQFFLQDRIKEGLEHDPLAKKIIDLAKDGKTRRFWLKGDMLFTKEDRLYIEQKKSGGLLESLPTPKGPWESVSMDFITCLPKSEGGGSIVVVADRFSKSEIHRALLDGVVQDHGDGFELLHEFSSPNGWANGEGECTIGALSSALSTRKSPFKLVTGHQPLTPNALATSYKGSSPAAYKTMKERHVEFEVGDQVMVKLLPQQFNSLRKVHKGLIRRYEGPFPVIGRIGKVGEDVPPRPILRGYSGLRIVLNLTRRLSGILWKVVEGLGSPWKLMEDLEASYRRL